MSALILLLGLLPHAYAACPQSLDEISLAIVCLTNGTGKCDACIVDPTCKTTKDDAWKTLKDPKKDIKGFRTGNNQTALQFALGGYGLKGSVGGQACSTDNEMTWKVADELLRRGVDINAPGSMGLTALHHSVLAGHSDVARYLVGKGADPRVKAGSGKFAGMDVFEFGKRLQKDKPDRAIQSALNAIAQKPKK
jgi:hypothetical protein